MLVGRRLAHERGMEFYATVKPYETGGSRASPAGSAETEYNPGLPCIGGMHASVQSWVMRRPEMRVRGAYSRSARRPQRDTDNAYPAPAEGHGADSHRA